MGNRIIFCNFAGDMAILHIFNPEHDIALAANLANFTAPHAGRQLRCDLGFIPALWANDGDIVVVDNVEFAEKRWKRLSKRLSASLNYNSPLNESHSILHNNCSFVSMDSSLHSKDIFEIQPWGWDKALKSTFKRKGILTSLLPSDDELEFIRKMSHRRVASSLLSQLQTKGTIGESFECTKEAEVEAFLQKYGQIVLKAPWSSSGRGLRFLSQDRTPFEMQSGWFKNLIIRQGSVMVEPYYNKVKDFGMEFSADGCGNINYEGLSLFHTVNGAYVGNILATEKTKHNMISRYISAGLLDDVKQKIVSCISLGNYKGPFGVDMMIVAGTDNFLIHPCVEINLRRTMGHVALTITPDDDDIVRVMRIDLTDHYKLKINKL